LYPSHTIANHAANCCGTNPTRDVNDDEDKGGRHPSPNHHPRRPNRSTITSSSITINNTCSTTIATATTSRFRECPICSKLFPVHAIELHAENCCDEGKDDDSRTITGVPSSTPDGISDSDTASGGGGGGACLIRHGLDPLSPRRHVITKEDDNHHYVSPPVVALMNDTNNKYEYGDDDDGSVGSTIPFSGTVAESQCGSDDNNRRRHRQAPSSAPDSPIPFSQPPQQKELDSKLRWKEIIKFKQPPPTSTRSAGGRRMPQHNKTIHIEEEIFPTSEPLPGIFLFDNFINQEEEQYILRVLEDGRSLDDGPQTTTTIPSHHHKGDDYPSPSKSTTTTTNSTPTTTIPTIPSSWKQSTFNGRHLGKRWGVHCNLRHRKVYPAPSNLPLPPFLQKLLLPRLQQLRSMGGCHPNEANAIDYWRDRGDYLKAHVDDRQMSKEPIGNLSIVGECYMTYRTDGIRGGGVGDGVVQKVLLKRRTLQVLTGKARYDYSHGICNEDILSDRRISITIRESPISSS